ncbi:MBL fold metallo-hydrolase, partial [Oleiphilus sp. HI0071]
LSAAPYIQKHVGGKLGIGEQISVVQSVFGKVFNEGAGFARDGSQFDHLFTDGERYTVGQLSCFALHTPGHTPACMTHVLGDAAFVGDTLFMPDAGTARCDFPGGSAETLYHSVQRILALEEDTRIFMCHDYAPNGRDLLFQTTVAEQRKKNIHVGEGIAKEDFVMMREARDATLDMPRLILPSLQVNMKAGHLPEPESNGLSYLKIPLNAFQ